jgi:diguanylate cyclase (GGDEF)-like protein
MLTMKYQTQRDTGLKPRKEIKNRIQPLNTIVLNHSQQIFQTVTIIFCLVVVILIDLLRLATGSEFALSLFFLIPIVIACWYVSIRTGIFLAIISATSWLMADCILEGYNTFWVPIVNECLRLIVFIFVIFVLEKLKIALVNQKHLSETDALTGLLNRRGFGERANNELNRFRRTKRPFSLVYFDIDNFKKINDQKGHKAGDQLLAQVGTILKTKIRSIDTVARLGGDEFILLLVDTHADKAFRLVEKLQGLLKNQIAKTFEKITFSFGITTSRSDSQDIDELVSQADEAMYLAKKNGKNRITYHIPSD